MHTKSSQPFLSVLIPKLHHDRKWKTVQWDWDNSKTPNQLNGVRMRETLRRYHKIGKRREIKTWKLLRLHKWATLMTNLCSVQVFEKHQALHISGKGSRPNFLLCKEHRTTQHSKLVCLPPTIYMCNYGCNPNLHLGRPKSCAYLGM